MSVLCNICVSNVVQICETSKLSSKKNGAENFKRLTNGIAHSNI